MVVIEYAILNELTDVNTDKSLLNTVCSRHFAMATIRSLIVRSVIALLIL